MAHKIEKIFIWLLLLIPVSIYFGVWTHSKTGTFITTILAIIPLARIIGFATKEIALQSNPAIGGLINATFGNIIELFICILALRKGLFEVVQASVVGSIMGNILLLMGLSIFAGGLKFKEQHFNRDSVGVSATMLIIAVVGLVIPTMYNLTTHASEHHVALVCDAVAVVLALVYISGLIFAFVTHKHLFDASDEIKASQEASNISIRAAGLLLLIATLIVAVESELLVKVVEEAAIELNLTQKFIGLVVIAIITNIAEKANAIHFALDNKLDISLEIGLSSAIQIALFVVPTLVVISQINGYHFSLVFPLFDIIPVFFAVLIVNKLSEDGKCNWLEGVQLVSVYFIIAIAFFFVGK